MHVCRFGGRCRFRKTKWLMEQYNDEQKVPSIIKKKTAEGKCAAEPEFPTDVDERYYWVLVDVSALHRNLREEEIGATGTSELTHEEAKELLGARGLLAAGSTLSIM